jgi:superfamily I DNA/RNA helicase
LTRSTVEVLAAASMLVAGDAFDDLDLVAQEGTRDVEVVRHGEVPTITHFVAREDLDYALVWDLCSLLDGGDRPGDVAVLVATNGRADEYLRLLQQSGVPTSLLKSPQADTVRVGTWHRAKGMEFGTVYLPQLNVSSQAFTNAGEQASEEKQQLLRRTQFVAMTRARDRLWVGYLERS